MGPLWGGKSGFMNQVFHGWLPFVEDTAAASIFILPALNVIGKCWSWADGVRCIPHNSEWASFPPPQPLFIFSSLTKPEAHSYFKMHPHHHICVCQFVHLCWHPCCCADSWLTGEELSCWNPSSWLWALETFKQCQCFCAIIQKGYFRIIGSDIICLNLD